MALASDNGSSVPLDHCCVCPGFTACFAGCTRLLQDAGWLQQRLKLLSKLVLEAANQPRVAAALARCKLLELLLEEGMRLEAAGKHAEVSSPALLRSSARMHRLAAVMHRQCMHAHLQCSIAVAVAGATCFTAGAEGSK
jgi:hypothetical protein